jgi:hypothetical protein
MDGRRLTRRAGANLPPGPWPSARADPVNRNIKPLYGFSFFDQFMIVIALWGPYLTTQGITMRQFMECARVTRLGNSDSTARRRGRP